MFATGRGMTGTLRKVLRGLVPSKKKRSSLASFGNENLLFICNHDYRHYRFAHFKIPEKDGQTAPLAAFGWSPGDPIRTLCEYNLNALEWPDGQPDAVFEKVEKLIGQYVSGTLRVPKSSGTRSVPDTLSGDDLRMFTQTLFNRLMFLRFIERKGWLAFGGRKDYLRAIYAAGAYGMKSFYEGRGTALPLVLRGTGH